jgi:hypothetical protein
VQTALLHWDPSCLPVDGANGTYGDETAGAVARFKVEVIGVPADMVIDDVGRRPCCGSTRCCPPPARRRSSADPRREAEAGRSLMTPPRRRRPRASQRATG